MILCGYWVSLLIKTHHAVKAGPTFFLLSWWFCFPGLISQKRFPCCCMQPISAIPPNNGLCTADGPRHSWKNSSDRCGIPIVILRVPSHGNAEAGVLIIVAKCTQVRRGHVHSSQLAPFEVFASRKECTFLYASTCTHEKSYEMGMGMPLYAKCFETESTKGVLWVAS